MSTHCTSLINYAFVINNIKPEQVQKCADNDNAANHRRQGRVIFATSGSEASRSLTVFVHEIPRVLASMTALHSET